MTDFDGMSDDDLRAHLRQLASAHARARGSKRPAPVKSSAGRASIEANRQRVQGVQARIDAERERRRVEAEPPRAEVIARTAVAALRYIRSRGWHRPLRFWEYGAVYDQATEARMTNGRISIDEALARAIDDVVGPFEPAGAPGAAARWLRVHQKITRDLAIATSSEPYIATWENQPDRTQAEVVRALAAVAMFSPAPATT